MADVALDPAALGHDAVLVQVEHRQTAVPLQRQNLPPLLREAHILYVLAVGDFELLAVQVLLHLFVHLVAAVEQHNAVLDGRLFCVQRGLGQNQEVLQLRQVQELSNLRNSSRAQLLIQHYGGLALRVEAYHYKAGAGWAFEYAAQDVLHLDRVVAGGHARDLGLGELLDHELVLLVEGLVVLELDGLARCGLFDAEEVQAAQVHSAHGQPVEALDLRRAQDVLALHCYVVLQAQRPVVLHLAGAVLAARDEALAVVQAYQNIYLAVPRLLVVFKVRQFAAAGQVVDADYAHALGGNQELALFGDECEFNLVSAGNMRV